MDALMQRHPLMISSLLLHAARHHPRAEVVSKTVEGTIHRYTYPEAERRARRLVRVLQRLGVQAGDRVATLAWNGHRHFEIYYAVSGMQAICHTVNPRLHPDDICYIVGNAADRLVFADTDLRSADRRDRAAHPRERARGRDDDGRIQHAGHRAGARHGFALLRDSDGGRGRGLCLAGVRREHRERALLHVGHHGPAEGRALQPSLDVAACLCHQHGRRARAARGGPRLAGRADVSRQCLGLAVCRTDERGDARHAGAAPGWGQLYTR